MQHEVRSIPPAPRRVRSRPLLAHRWPLLAIGLILIVLGSLVAWAMFLQAGGKFSFGPRLDIGPTALVSGEVTEVADPVKFDDREWQYVRYSFEFGYHHTKLAGACFVDADTQLVGDVVDIEVLVDDPNINRIVGGLLHIDRQWLHARFWFAAMVIPGALILLGWLAGMFQLRHVLVHGDVSVGRVITVERVPYVLPEMLRVGYEFRDHRAVVRRNRHWVRARGELGQRLILRGPQRDDALPVLHDRRLPQWNRLLLPGDFLHTTPPKPEVPELT